MDVDVYESTKTRGPYLIVQRDRGRIAAPGDVRARFVPGQLVMRLRMIATDTIVGLNVVEAIAAILRDRYYVAQGPIDFGQIVGQQRSP